MAAQKHPMETYHGIVRTPADAIKLFEACRLGLLPRVQRRLSEKERQAIRSGSVFVWDEREAGMRRWTDGKSWSASRVSGSFLTYREMEGKRGGGFNTMRRVTGKTPDSSGRGSDEDQDDGEPDGYRYKADGLMKQSFSITTSNGQHLHLISYYARPSPGEPELPQPTTDPSMRTVVPIKGMYPESSMSDNTPIPAVSRVPLAQQHHHQAQYPHHPPPLSTGGPGYHQPYPPYGQQGYSWPPSPIATPPYNHHYTTASAPYPPQPPPGHYARNSPPPSAVYYGQHHIVPPQYGGPPPPPPPPPGAYDRMPPLPPPQPTRTTPPVASSYGQGPGAHLHHLSNSPRSLYRQPAPQLPPVSTAGSGAPPAYQTPPGSRSNLPPVSGGPLPALTTTAPQNGGSSALTPPRPLSESPTRSAAYQYNQSNQQQSSGVSPSSTGNKASLSALLHPTPASSEPNSANAASSNSASSSPRHVAAAAAAVAAAAAAPGGAAAQFLQPAPSGEDSRALSRLDKKFCI